MSSITATDTPLYIHRTAPMRVTYRDTDRMGYVYYSQYLVWFEVGRTDLLRSLGSTYKYWEDEHKVFLPVRDATIQYRQPAVYDDEIVVETHMTKLSKVSVAFSYLVIRIKDNQVLATGTTSHPFVNDSGQICRIGDKLLPQFFLGSK